MGIEWLAVGLAALVGLMIWKRKLVRILVFVVKYGNPPPINRISLVETSEPNWRRRRRIARMAATFHELGFESLGTYRIPELQDSLWWSFVRASDGMVGALTEHPVFGCSADAVYAYTDGTSLTVTNNSLCSGLDCMPAHARHVFVKMKIPALVEYAEANRGEQEIERLDKHAVARRAEAEFEQEMTWRNDRGGVSATEIAANGAGVGAKQAAQVARELNNRSAVLTREQCKLACLDEAGMSLADYEEVVERIVVVLAADSARHIIGLVSSASMLDAERHARLRSQLTASSTASAKFDAVFDEVFPGGQRLATTVRPAGATAYVLPEAY